MFERRWVVGSGDGLGESRAESIWFANHLAMDCVFGLFIFGSLGQENIINRYLHHFC